MRLGSLFAGGKDSTLAMQLAMEEGHEIAALITLASENPESYMFHVPNIELTPLHAEAMGIPIIYRRTEGVKEAELRDLKGAVAEAVREHGIDGVVSGAISSNYQRTRIDHICGELGIGSLVPLWKRPAREMLSGMVAAGYRIVMSAVAADGLGPEWLGREIDGKAIEELTTLHDTCYVCTAGEGGEFETLVLDAPIFKKRLVILEAERLWSGQSGIYKVRKAVLEDK
jgi:diphthine-ammonia ligase